ncbi:MAG: nickel pincer cofactor biosynthesis protein LarC [Phycisphaerae bacterium]|nr:nickel pincer cofactor biosynthesis protein LarC [Phycisphaerae bacterium]
MNIGYFDCFSGASGDMILGAFVSAGLPLETLRAELARLHLPGYELDVRHVTRRGFAATKVDVKTIGKPDERHLRDIIEIIDGSDLTVTVKDRATRTFTRLAEAEANVHGTPVEDVHFHEVGAVDAIVDVVGAAIGIEEAGLERIVCSPVPTGSGTVRCDHGVLPVPAPATVELLAGVPLAACDEVGELTTPTGAAILTTLADRYGPMPAMTIRACGYGAGSREGGIRPNLLRLLIGEATADVGQVDDGTRADEVVIIEANLDDATGEQIGHAFEALFAAGALDVFTTPIMMKKNRPGVLLSALAPLERQQACEDVFFAETTTFGVRRHACTRRKLARSTETVSTRFGEIRVKVGRRGARGLTAAPEYEDCAQAGREHRVALREVISAAQQAWWIKHGKVVP